MTPQTTLRIRPPVPVIEPRGAIVAAALMLKLLRALASLAASAARRPR